MRNLEEKTGIISNKYIKLLLKKSNNLWNSIKFFNVWRHIVSVWCWVKRCLQTVGVDLYPACLCFCWIKGCKACARHFIQSRNFLNVKKRHCHVCTPGNVFCVYKNTPRTVFVWERSGPTEKIESGIPVNCEILSI